MCRPPCYPLPPLLLQGAPSIKSRTHEVTTVLPPLPKQDPSADIRQSAFALVGDLAKTCAPHLRPVAPAIMQSSIYNLEPQMVTQVGKCSLSSSPGGWLLCLCRLRRLRCAPAPNLPVILLRSPQHNMSACNNACWALGELAVKLSAQDLNPIALQARQDGRTTVKLLQRCCHVPCESECTARLFLY